MNFILTCLLYNFNLQMGHNCQMGTNIIQFFVDSNKNVLGWQEIQMH